MRHCFWLAVALAVVASAGCGNSRVGELAGIWHGEFKPSAESELKMRKEWGYRGYLQLYVTNMKFKMRLESLAQIVDVTGTWKVDQSRVTLSVANVAFDDLGGQVRRRPGITPIPPEAVREAFSQQLVLDYESEGQTLAGLDMTLGPILGKTFFKKGKENRRFLDQ